MKKVKKLSLTDLVLYGLVFMVPIAPVSLYGVVYNLSHGMVALVYIIGAIAMFFTAYSYSTLSQHISSSGSAYAYAGVCINPAVGFLTGWILLLDYLLFPTLVAVLGGVAVRYFTANSGLGLAVDLCGYWHRSQLSRDTANGEIR